MADQKHAVHSGARSSEQDAYDQEEQEYLGAQGAAEGVSAGSSDTPIERSREFPACNCDRERWQNHTATCAITLRHMAAYERHPIGCLCGACSVGREYDSRDPRDLS